MYLQQTVNIVYYLYFRFCLKLSVNIVYYLYFRFCLKLSVNIVYYLYFRFCLKQPVNIVYYLFVFTTDCGHILLVYLINTKLCRWCLEFADCIISKGIRPPTLKKREGVVLGMTLNCVWWWGSSSRDLESVEYPFIAITPRSIVTQSVRILSVGQMDQFENYQYQKGMLKTI